MRHGKPQRPRSGQLLFAWAVIALAATYSASAKAQAAGPISVTLKVDRTEILVGQPIEAQLQMQWKSGTARIEALALGEKIGAFDVLDIKESPEREIEAGEMVRSAQVRVTSFETGDHELGPIEVPYIDEAGKVQTVRTETIGIKVGSVLPSGTEETTIRPVRSPLEIPARYMPWLIAAGAALLALVLLVLFVRIVRRRIRTHPDEAPAPIPLDPDEEALRALAELETSGVLERALAKEVYTRLSYILRRYVGRRHRFDALEMTSSELFDAVERMGWSGDLLDILRNDLGESDSVKFAKYTPGLAKRQAALERVRAIVDRTRPRVQTPAQSDGGNGSQ